MATKKKTFEEAIAELETIVEALENGSASLEDSLDMYQKGIELTKLCQDKLQSAEKRMEVAIEVLYQDQNLPNSSILCGS